ncbi:MAG: zinc-binding alcohol dehydrogenase family protein [Betaproteobacteria bacterium]
MKAVGYRSSLPIDNAESLLDLTLPDPVPGARDLVVAVKAISVNPVDTKVRMRAAPDPGQVKVLGFDAAGVVSAVGAAVTLFRPGDEVFYAGSIARPGTNSELHAVDERIVGPKPRTLSFAQAAALPLTGITAWELLFDRLGLVPGDSQRTGTLLIVGGAGGVGSIMIQLARKLTGLTVIATASRAESQKWITALGAHHVVDHSKPLAAEVRALGIQQVDVVASLTHSEQHLAQIAEIIAPQGRFGMIDDPKTFDILALKRKSVSIHWEFMFTRAVFETADMIAQHQLLKQIADMVDAGALRSTPSEEFGTINAANLRRAHALIESGRATGKIVLSGF